MKSLKPHLVSQNKNFDFILLGSVTLSIIFGLVVIMGVSSIQGFREFSDPYIFIKQQLIWVALGFFSLLLLANFDYHRFKFFIKPLFLAVLILTVAVFIPGFGAEAGGASRWLKIGNLTIQPIEIMKLVSILWLACFLEKGASLKPIFALALFTAVVVAYLQKDLGSSVVIIAILVSMYYLARGSLWKIIFAAALAIGAFFMLILTSEYRKKRVLAFFDPFSDPQGFSYHIYQALIALGSGGLIGLGIGQSRQKFFIPEGTTDSIFAIIGEEVGFVGTSVLVIILGTLIMRGFKIAAQSQDNMGKILAGGLSSWLGFQIVLNLSAMVGLVPLTGVPLPFISYGGSAMVANLAAVGILLNISKTS